MLILLCTLLVTAAPALQAAGIKVYPNPVKRGKLKFEVNTPDAAKVGIRIYTAAGALAWSNEYEAPAGKSVFVWDLSTPGGKAAPDVYVYRVLVGSGGSTIKQVGKVLVIK